MEELIYKLAPKAWFETSVNPFTKQNNQIHPSGTISAGDRFVESELAKLPFYNGM